MTPSNEFQSLCAYLNGLLPEDSLQVTPIGLPPRAIKLVRHDLKHDDVVPLGLAALLPQTLGRSARGCWATMVDADQSKRCRLAM